MKPNKYISKHILFQIAFIFIIIVVFSLITTNLLTFFPGFLGAMCFYALLLNPLKWLTIKKKWNRSISVIVLIILSAMTITIPIYLLLYMLTNKVLHTFNKTSAIKSYIKEITNMVETNFNIDILSTTNVEKITKLFGRILESLLNSTINMGIQFGVAFLILYFLLMNYDKLESWFYKSIPIKSEQLERMNSDLKDLIISNTIGIPLTAFFQATIAYIGYLIFGVTDSFTWFIFTIFAAMLPLVGASLIYIPISLLLFVKEESANAIGLLIYCFLVVGISDNFIRLILQKQMKNVHPLITIFGVIVGINLFGFIGIIFGPIFISFFFWLVKLYKYEFNNQITNN